MSSRDDLSFPQHIVLFLTLQTQLPGSCQRDHGPNVCITPGGDFTSLHQDGNGTVDSGHCCHEGDNEVLMLQRGTDKQMKQIKTILVGDSCYDPTAAHGNGAKPPWPTAAQIEKCGDVG